MALKKPIKIGKYEVVGLLGKGGMGVVYKANDPLLGRAVAIKMMTTLDYVDNPDLLQRFYREAQSTGNLHHRNIVTVYELGDHEGSPYLVMEYLEGETLDAVIQGSRPISLFDRINFILEVCDGLSYAHARSVVHRDIKPGNIMVLKDSGVKIVDFGIAHIGNRTVTRTGQLLGSLPYMSPEQISGKQVDARTDIFSLGVVFYQLLTTHLPFDGETPAATLLKIIQERPKPLSEYGKSFPAELDEILLRALAKDREQRYPSAQDFAYDLIQIRGRIQQELVDEHLNEAELLLSREEFVKAREKLAEVLKIDRHNSRAVELSRATLLRIQQQEQGEQVRQLRVQAEEAFQKEQFDQALDAVRKAINLHPTDRDLQRLRSSVEDARAKTEKLRRSLKRAESAYEQGELDSAKQAIEEALSVAPDDAQAKSLDRMIQRDWAQRAQRLQVLGFIDEARREIASRNFTLAIEVLRKAEAIDAASPEVQALIDAANAAREQERRRKALETAKREIEADLDRDDFQQATSRADAALKEFPEDRGLQKLRDLAEKQRAFAERKSFIRDSISQSRALLESGQAEQALQALQTAHGKVGAEPQLESFIVVVRETIERHRVEARKSELLRRAKDQLRLKEYDGAIQTLKAAQAELGATPEIDDLLQFAIEQQIVEKRRQVADAAAQKAQAFVKDGDYGKAVDVLEEALKDAPDEELSIILAHAKQAAAEHRKLLEEAIANTDSMLRGQRPAEALRYLQSQPESFSRDARFAELFRKAQEQSERLQHINRALEKARTHLGKNEFDPAVAALQECIRTYGRTPELNKLVAQVEQRQGEALAETMEQALSASRALIGEGKADQALERLSSMNTMAGRVSPELSRALQSLQQEATAAQVRKYKNDIEQLLAQGSHEEANSLLRHALAEFQGNRDLQTLSKALQQAVQRRSDAAKLLDQARELFAKQQWREGADICLRAEPLTTRDPVERNKIFSTLESVASSVVERDWRSAEHVLGCLTQLQPNFVPSSAIQGRISQAQHEESVKEVLNAAAGIQSRGDIDGALAAVKSGLAQDPHEPRLVELDEKLRRAQKEKRDLDRREQERKERQDFVAGIQQRSQSERSADGRVKLLEEALRKYPDATGLQESLVQARELQRKVATFADDAARNEKTQKYDLAIRSWTSIAQLGIVHPQAEEAISRLTGKREQARAAAKSAWLSRIQDSLAAYELEKAGSLLIDAQRELPNDPQLAAAAASRDKILKRRQENISLLNLALDEFAAQRWQRGSELVDRGRGGAPSDPAVATAASSALIEGTRAATGKDLHAAGILLDQLTRIQSNAPEIADLRNALTRRTYEEAVDRRFAELQALVQKSGAESALNAIDAACSEFPNESRFPGLKQELVRSIDLEKQAQARQSRLIEILDAAQALRAGEDLSGALKKVEQGLQEFPGHSQFVEMKRSLEKAIRDLEKQNQREEKQRTQALVQQEKQDRQDQQRREREETKRRATEARTAQVSAQRAETAAPRPWKAYAAIGVAVVAFGGAVAWFATHRALQPAETMTVAAIPAVQITTSPDGAVVRDAQTGASCVTPRCALQLSAGAHELKIELPGYQPVTRSISVDANGASPISVALLPIAHSEETPEAPTPAAPPAVARLNLRNAQPGAEVLVDRKRVGRIGNAGSFSADVAPGSHEVALLSRNQQMGQVQRDFASGGRVELTRNDFINASKMAPPAEAAGSEQADWQKVRNSQDVSAVEGFIKRHPGGAFTAQAQSKLEGFDWAKAVAGGTAAGYSQYLNKFPGGKYAQQAQGQIADLDWRAVENTTDTAALQDFVRRYPAGGNHDKAAARLDDLSWQQTNQNDAAGLRAYAGNFPEGRHASEARKKLEDLSRPASPPRNPDNRATSTPPVDDNKAIIDILARYQKAYESEDVGELQKIWPGMTGGQIKGVGDFFQQASGLSLQYQVTQTEINGDTAIVRFTQNLKYSAGGKSGKNSAKIIMQLNRTPAGWRINSIR
jgi:serine/threonine-protein kinase